MVLRRVADRRRHGGRSPGNENDGSEAFTANSTISTAADGCVAVLGKLDVDGDGDMDVLSASLHDDTIAWYENDGSQSFTPMTSAQAPRGDQRLCGGRRRRRRHGRTQRVVIRRHDRLVRERRQPGLSRRMSSAFPPMEPAASFAADVDRDGDHGRAQRVLVRRQGRLVREPDRQPGLGGEHTISVTADGAFSVSWPMSTDDGDMDVLSASFEG